MKHYKNLVVLLMLGLLGISDAFAQIPITQLRAIDCGKTNLTPNAQIQCLPVAGATNYQWEFRDVITNTVVGTFVTSGVVYAPILGGFLQWNTQYNCSIRAKVGGVFGAYGPSCLIGLMQDPSITGVAPTQLRPLYCGANLLMSSSVFCFAVPMSNFYEFTFTDIADTTLVSTKITTSLGVALNTVSPALAAGHSYKVKVRAFVYNTYSAPGLVCNIYIMRPVSNVVAGFDTPVCAGGPLNLHVTFDGGVPPFTFAWTGPGGFSSNLQDPIVSPAVAGSYIVVVTGGLGTGSGTDTAVVTVNPVPAVPTITGDFGFCPDNFTTLDAGSGYTSYAWSYGFTTQTANVLLPDAYTVVVSNSFGCTSTGSIEVAPCSSSVTPTSLRSIDCFKQNLTPNAQIQCTPVATATNYQWEFRDINTLDLYASRITNGIAITPGMTTPQLQWNTLYIARVRAKVGGQWGNYSTLCTIGLMQDPAITGVDSTALRTVFCDSTMSTSALISCEPVPMGSIYEFEFTDISTSTVTTKQVAGIYLNLNSVSPALQAGRTYAVRVKALVYTTWGNYGNSCNITIGSSPGASSREMPVSTTNQESAIKNAEESSLMEISTYPNPFSDEITITVAANADNTVNGYLYDVTGALVWSQQIITNSIQKIEPGNIPAGIYTLRVISSSGNNKSIRLIKK